MPAALWRASCFFGLLILTSWPATDKTQAAELSGTTNPGPVPWNDIGARAGANYNGDGLSVTLTESGARLHCVFQRLDAKATTYGLCLTSTVTDTVSDCFTVAAIEVGRIAADGAFSAAFPDFSLPLPESGEVSVWGQTVRFSRPGLTEEYSVSMDGVRQDFIVEQAPFGPPGGDLVVNLAVSGAQVESIPDGARLTLDASGRKIAYSRLRVTDATGKELPAWMEAASVESEATGLLSPTLANDELAVVVNDAGAVYPVRIDPTFSDANWISMGGLPGVNGQVYAAATDGSGNLYVGGNFTTAGGISANNIAQWNGSVWLPLGSGLGGGFPGYATVYALAVSEGVLYAGGQFTLAGGDAANNIAQWNGSVWSALGPGVNDNVLALAVSAGTLYAGGNFTTAGGNVANAIAQWNGGSWSVLGSGVNGSVAALAVSGNTLYAGGSFTTAGGNPASDVAQWNGTVWSGLGSGLNNGVDALATSGGTLFAAGYFTTAGGSAANSIAQWNGTTWSSLGSGVNSDVSALVVSGGTLYVGGFFTLAGGNVANGIAQWNGSSWSPLGPVIKDNTVHALAVSGGILYAGGTIYAGANYADGIAQWNGTNWSTLNSGGISGMGADGYGPFVNALTVLTNTIYAGGDFTYAGDIVANNIAQWNGSAWSALGSGISGGNGIGASVNALAVLGGALYVGGDFTNAGGVAANNIAQWNGRSWLPLGSGISGGDEYNSLVKALAVSGNMLYAGGQFTNAGGATAANIAQWNGSAWSPLGSGISGAEGDFGGPSVYALAVSGGTLYAGGIFSMAGGNVADGVAQWNGGNWSPLGSGVGVGGVYALAVSGSTLYAGGQFTTAGGNAANDIAQWDGSSWSPLGSGVSGAGGDLDGPYVNALLVSGSALYVGGDFTTAGTNVSAYAAMAELVGTPVSLAIVTTNAAFGFTHGVFGFDVLGPPGASVVVQASVDLQTWIPVQTNQLGSGLLYFSDSQAATNVQRFYRVQLSP